MRTLVSGEILHGVSIFPTEMIRTSIVLQLRL